ncbi:MAG TPA: HAD-IIB family hydrolase [Candidatus Saccharimonadales bacterium]|nr:HAD-IIB family hydrolase [Candidatus Saccharimonadales bacterium]
MKYKALLLDVDGTLVINHEKAIPSQRVIEALTKVKDIIHIGLATNRSYHLLSGIFEDLPFLGPCIINGATQIIDPKNKKILWERKIGTAEVSHILAIADKLSIGMNLQGEERSVLYSGKNSQDKILGLYTQPLSPSDVEKFTKAISDISTISIHKTSSWEKDKMHVSINHLNASKQYAVYELAKILNITQEEIIGVGDHYNDFPLLMACGLKVAMGNAVEDLKAIADYVAPTVEEDGVVDVIEKFI